MELIGIVIPGDQFACRVSVFILAVKTGGIVSGYSPGFFFGICRRLGARPTSAALTTIALGLGSTLWV